MSNENSAQSGKEHDKKLHLIIATTAGPWEHPFEPTTTVQQVIDDTIAHFKGELTTPPYELRVKGATSALDPNQTLSQAGLKDKENLTLVRVTPGGGK